MRKNLLIVILLVAILNVSPSKACTNFLVTKGASTDGSTMITYAADSHTLYGELYFWPAATHVPGTMFDVYEWDTGNYMGKIEQVPNTYRVVGNMNEYSLAIGETTFGGREELVDSTGIIDYGSLIYLTLQRAKNAREAIKIMTELVEKYGYHSGGESFSISDPNEVWMLEMISKGIKYKKDKKGKLTSENQNKGAVWVAVRIPDGYIAAHANQARIQTFPRSNGTTSISSKEMDKIFNPEVEVVYAHDVVEIARQYGYFKGEDKDFSFSDVYNPIDFSGARFCDARVWAYFLSLDQEAMQKYEDYAMGHNLKNRMPLYIKPKNKVSFQQTADMMRDHYEGTVMDMTSDLGAGAFKSPYRWRPMTWEVDGGKYVHERAIATQQTGFWFVAQGRSKMPQALAGIIWFGVDDAATSCLTPVYSCSEKVAPEFKKGNGDLLTYSETSAFWIFNRVTNFAYGRYDVISADIRKVQRELEAKHLEYIEIIDAHAAKLYKEDKAKAVSFVTDFSVNTASTMVSRWKELDKYLLVKYIDGNIKKEKNGEFQREPSGMPSSPHQPQLPEEWRKMIKSNAGDKLKMKE